MIEPAQIRAARGLLDINQTDLSRASGVGLATIKRIENSKDTLRVTVDVLLRIQRTLEAAGVVFIDQDGKQGSGVRLLKPSSKAGPIQLTADFGEKFR